MTVGNVFDSPEILEAYSTDRSALKIKPRAVAFPESTDDICKLMKFCYQLAIKNIKIPVAVRGSGLDKMGADLTSGLVISTEKLNRLLESDRRERLVRVQAGITLRELKTALSVNGLTIPIKGHDDETIGGLISNCPIDRNAHKYGGIMKYVKRIEIVLANGDCLQTDRFKKRALAKKKFEKSLEGDIYRKLDKIMDVNSEAIERIKDRTYDKSGYPNIAYTKHRNAMDLAPLLFGAEGTLGVITEAIIKAVPIKKPASPIVATFENYAMAEKFLAFVKELHPCELNIYDISILKSAEEDGKKLNDITKRLETGYVVTAQFDSRSKTCIKKVLSIKKMLPRKTQLVVDPNKAKTIVGEIESALTSFLNGTKNYERIPLLTDFYIPAENMPGLIEDLDILHEKLDLDLALYGSYATSIYNLQPKFNLEDEELGKKALAFLRAGEYIIRRRGGALVGGSPEGRIKALATGGKVPQAEKNLYLEIKAIFDRYEMINPGVKFDVDTRSTLNHFRTTGSPKIMI